MVRHWLLAIIITDYPYKQVERKPIGVQETVITCTLATDKHVGVYGIIPQL